MLKRILIGAGVVLVGSLVGGLISTVADLVPGSLALVVGVVLGVIFTVWIASPGKGDRERYVTLHVIDWETGRERGIYYIYPTPSSQKITIEARHVVDVGHDWTKEDALAHPLHGKEW